MKNRRCHMILAWILILICIITGGCDIQEDDHGELQLVLVDNTGEGSVEGSADEENIAGDVISFNGITVPTYSGEAYVVINDNVPFFTEDDLTYESYEHYSELDRLGRCGVAMANIGVDLMPTEKRGDISEVKPSGWHHVEYDNVDGKVLYNRSHLIAFQLAGENANEKNLITGTRYMNAKSMLPFEEAVGDYVRETGNHVLYRVTPVFEGDNLVASGIEMEALSVEDEGADIEFNVFIYNVQPGITIDYSDGYSWLEEDTQTQPTSSNLYILNINSKKFHLPSCKGTETMSKSNRQEFTGSRKKLISQGYEPCGVCNP